MDLEEYITLATRTESRPENITANPQLIVNLLTLFTCSGRMLDQLKKHVFYNRPYDADKFNLDYQSMVATLQHMTWIQINGTDAQMGNEPIKNINPRLFHAIIGIATEATELCEALLDTQLQNEIDLVNLREEIGDVSWYIAILFDTLQEIGHDGTWEDVLERNIEKLRARFPDKFTNEDANNRDLETERQILEKDDPKDS